MLRGMFVRRIHCIGCGKPKPAANLTLINGKPPAAVPNVASRVQKKLTEELLPQMSAEQLKALNWNTTGVSIPSHEQKFIDFKDKLAKKSVICHTCSLTRSGTLTLTECKHGTERSREAVEKSFHVADALDFPMGFRNLKLSDVDIFVINRCDLLVSHESQLNKLKKYFMDTFFMNQNISESNVVLCSALKGWNLVHLSNQLARSNKCLNVFRGKTNVGKTSLVHALSGTDKVDVGGGATAWPVPFITEVSQEYISLSRFRSRKMIDTPSLPFDTSDKGCFHFLRQNLVRKVSAGVKMTDASPKYSIPKVAGKTGQTISIGGLIALEFPHVNRDCNKRLSFHVFCGIGGLNHTGYLNAFRDLDTVHKINGADESYKKMRMHDIPGLRLVEKLSFAPMLAKNERQSLVIEGMGFIQPLLFGKYPDNYKVKVWAAKEINVDVRKEVLVAL